MKIVKLNMIERTPQPQRHESVFGEDDNVAVLPVPDQVVETTKPVAIVVDQVRNFYPRKGDRVGTRILFRNGSALPVKETFDEVVEAFTAA